MLDLIGHILNWTILLIAFPLALLPLSAFFGSARLLPTIVWIVMIAVASAAGILYLELSPRLGFSAPLARLVPFSAFVAALAAIVAIAGGPRIVSLRLSRAFEIITRSTGRAAMWLVFLMAFTQFAVVILRYVFGINSLAMQESVTYMHGAVFLVAAGYALITNDHVRVDILYGSLSERMKGRVDLTGVYLFLFPMCFLLWWTASPYVARSWAVQEGSAEASGIPALFLLKSLIPLFATLMAMGGFVVAVKAQTKIQDEDARK